MPAAQQDVAPTLAAALGTRMPPTATGHVLPVLQSDFVPPRVVMLLVLDGMRRDYFDRYAASMPTLTALRERAAWFSQSSVNFFPTNTSVGHATLATGADPRVHGITGNNIYDRVQQPPPRHVRGRNPGDLVAMTLADVWQLETAGRAIIIAQGSVERAATPLAGHGSCQLNGSPSFSRATARRAATGMRTPHASGYRSTSGTKTRERCGRRAGNGWDTRSIRRRRCDIPRSFHGSKLMR